MFLLASSSIQAQRINVNIVGVEKDSFLSITKINTTYNSSTEAMEALYTARQFVFNLGYMTVSYDSMNTTDSTLNVFLFLGKKYTWTTLKNENIPSNLLAQSRFDARNYFGKKVDVKTLYPVFDKIIRYYEDNGFPFCSLSLDSVQIKDGQVAGNLHLNKGPMTKIDTVIINEDVNISHNFVYRYLGIYNGMIYNESKIKSINTRISELPFLANAYPWQLDFNIAKTTLKLYLKNKSANKADVLIGLLPNNAEIGGKFLLTGDIKLGFSNALGQAEQIQINWQNLQYKSPRYNIQFSIPYILNTPIGISGKFDFYKKDTTFKTTKGELGLLYALNSSDQIKVYYELSGNRIGTVNTQNLIATKKLPANGDVTYRTVGLELIIQKVDNKLNPRKGYKILCNGGVSFRNIIKNTTVENTFDITRNETFSYLYDSVQLKNYKYNLYGQVSYFTPLSKRFILASIYSGGITYSTNPLFRNELFQLGGYRLLRGFDEGSLYVSQYHVLTLEPRYLLSQNSYFFLFTDLALIQSRFSTSFTTDNPYSVGLGMTFETKSGLFNISYGVGASNNSPMQFRNSKIHFGYINYF